MPDNVAVEICAASGAGNAASSIANDNRQMVLAPFAVVAQPARSFGITLPAGFGNTPGRAPVAVCACAQSMRKAANRTVLNFGIIKPPKAISEITGPTAKKSVANGTRRSSLPDAEKPDAHAASP